MSKDVMLFRFLTGEEVMAKVAELEEGFVLQNPVQIISSHDGQGQVKMGLASFMPYAAEGIFVLKTAIMAICEPKDSLADSYLEMTTGIQVASNKIITGV